MNTGTPMNRAMMKITMSRVMARASIRRGKLGRRRVAPAAPRVAHHVEDLASEHQQTAERDAAIDDAHRQIEHGHALVLHALGDEHGEVCEQAEEAELDGIEQGEQE